LKNGSISFRPVALTSLQHLLLRRSKAIYTYYKKRRDSRHWWRRIQSRKYKRVRVLTKKGVQVVMISVLIYLLAGLSSGRNYLWLLAWSLIVGTILISSKKYLRASNAQERKPPNTDAVLQNTEDEKEMQSTPSRIIQIPTEKQRKKNIICSHPPVPIQCPPKPFQKIKESNSCQLIR